MRRFFVKFSWPAWSWHLTFLPQNGVVGHRRDWKYWWILMNIFAYEADRWTYGWNAPFWNMAAYRQPWPYVDTQLRQKEFAEYLLTRSCIKPWRNCSNEIHWNRWPSLNITHTHTCVHARIIIRNDCGILFNVAMSGQLKLYTLANTNTNPNTNPSLTRTLCAIVDVAPAAPDSE